MKTTIFAGAPALALAAACGDSGDLGACGVDGEMHLLSGTGEPEDVALRSSTDGERMGGGCILGRPDSGALETLRSFTLAIDPAGNPVVVTGYSNADFEDTLVLGWVAE
jgi:hypothetical protein